MTDTDNYCGGRWHRNHPLTGPSETDKRRYPPDGDRARWIAEGPPGHQNHQGRASRVGKTLVTDEELDRTVDVLRRQLEATTALGDAYLLSRVSIRRGLIEGLLEQRRRRAEP